VLGHLVDKVGHRAWICLAATSILTAAHLAMGFTTIPAAYLLVGLGLGYRFLIYLCIYIYYIIYTYISFVYIYIT